MCFRQPDPLRCESASFDHVSNILQPHRADGNQLVEIRQRFRSSGNTPSASSAIKKG